MEARNADNELPDGRPLSKKIEDDGNAPSFEETKQGVDKETESEEKAETEEEQRKEGAERAEDYVEEKVESNTSLLLREIGNLEVRTLDDLRRIKQLVCSAEGKDKC